MGDSRDPTRWKEFAEQDLQTAEYLANTMRPTPLETICYLCHQSVEKYLKGFLILHGEEPPYIHDLSEICRFCQKINSAFSLVFSCCSELNSYGVQPKYPTEMTIDESGVKRALNDAKKRQDFLRQQTPELFTE